MNEPTKMATAQYTRMQSGTESSTHQLDTIPHFVYLAGGGGAGRKPLRVKPEGGATVPARRQ
jgi:hypothetical protein